MSAEIPKAPELGLQIGDALLMQPLFGSAERRYRSHLIGASSGQSLLVTIPADANGVLAVQDGEGFTLRAFVGDRALAFTSSVIKVCSQPYRYLHLTYPQRLEQVVVRRSRRLDLERSVQVVLASPADPVQMTLVNLSTTGAMLVGPKGVVEIGNLVTVKTSFSFEGMSDQPASLPAMVKNTKDEKQGADLVTFYGFEFRELPTATEIALRAFVFERMYTAGRQ